MRLIGVDIDDTVVEMSSLYKQYELDNPYKDKLDFWRSDILYDNLEPVVGSVEALESLSKYFGIVFVSRLKGSHHRSKVYFAKRWFPFMTGFVGTHEKWILEDSLEALVDDDCKNLVKFSPHKRILFGDKKECDVALNLKMWNKEAVQQICDMYL